MSIEGRGQVILSTGNTSENVGWKAPRGVITLDIERGAIHIHDGETYGGRHVIYLPDARNFIEAQAAGKPGGVATLDDSGALSQNQWPESMHQITGYGEKSLFPAEGEAIRFYLDQSTLTLYAWHNKEYVALNPTVTAKDLGVDALVNHKPLVDTDADKLMALETTGVITGSALATILKGVGIIQDSTGKWGWDQTNNSNDHGELPNSDPDMDSDGISHTDTAVTTRLMMRPAASINTAFMSEAKYSTTTNKEYRRFKYGSTGANWGEVETFGGQVIEETQPMYVYSKDKMECAIGLIDCAGSSPDYRQPAYLKFTGFVQEMSLQKLDANIKDALLALPMSFGMVDQPDTLDAKQFLTDYSVTVSIKGQYGIGVTYTSGVDADGTSITMIGKVGDDVVDHLTGLKGHPFQGILVPRLTKDQATNAFPSNTINTADGLGYVQVVGDLEIIMTVAHIPSNQSADITIDVTVNTI